jgi:anti-sigma regulatory factor (Ser/Thr protein kinase)
MDKTTEIRLNNDLIEINKVSGEFENLGEKHNIPMKVIMDLCLAADEVITNIISYGYNDKENHIIIVRIYFEGDMLITEVEDDARPFNPLDLPEVDVSTAIEEKKIGGLGIHLVRNLMDKFEYNRINDKNILLFGKKIK